MLTTSGDSWHRITPAWAGKSFFSWFNILPSRDHPRVGGEKELRKLGVTG